MNSNFKRTLGKSGIEVSALGLGCWPIGGPWRDPSVRGGKTVSMGKIDDKESLRAIARAIDLGINFFDTAEGYGNGHSETILGRGIKGKRDKVVIATKIAHIHSDQGQGVSGTKVSPDVIRKACEESLKRLGTDYIDLYQLHLWSIPLEEAAVFFHSLDTLKKDGLIREYGWSTDHPDCIDFLVKKTDSTAIQHQLNVFINADSILDVCEKYNQASLNRSPLAMGLLSGRFNNDSKLEPEDFRGNNIDWMMYFKDGKPNSQFLEKLEAVRQILTAGGRSMVQGALAWLWAKSEKTIPIPGFRTEKQVTELAGAREFGPLTKEQTDEIHNLIEQISI